MREGTIAEGKDEPGNSQQAALRTRGSTRGEHQVEKTWEAHGKTLGNSRGLRTQGAKWKP